MSLSIGTVTKRSSISLQRKLAKNPQIELINFKLKFFEKLKNEKNQEIYTNSNKIEINSVSGFNKFKFNGQTTGPDKKIDKSTIKLLIHSKSIVGETNGGKSWLIQIPFNEEKICLTISKKFVPKIKEVQLEDLINAKEDRILEIFWHLNHNIVLYKLDANGFSYIGKKKIVYLTSFIKTIHLLAVTAMKLEVEKISIVKIIQDNLVKELENQDDPDGQKLITINDILTQLKKNRDANYNSIKRSELKVQEAAKVIKQLSRPPDESNNSLYRTKNDSHESRALDDLDQQMELAEHLKDWT